MLRHREEVEGAEEADAVTGGGEVAEVTGEGGRIAGDVGESTRPERGEVLDEALTGAAARRIQDDEVGLGDAGARQHRLHTALFDPHPGKVGEIVPGIFDGPLRGLHAEHRTVLAEILDRRTGLSVKLADQDESARPGTAHIAPPDRHLLVGPDGALTLTRSELVHFLRPSADLLFESVAGAYDERAIAIVLSGTGSDGAMGVDAVKSRGGTVIAQDPRTAEFKGMPEAAVGTGAVDFVLPLEEIPAVLRGLVGSKRQ